MTEDENQAYIDSGMVYLEHPDGPSTEIAPIDEIQSMLDESEDTIRNAIGSFSVDDGASRWIGEKGQHAFLGMLNNQLRDLTGEVSEGYLYLRLFPVADPSDAVRGTIHLKKAPEWDANLVWECPDRFDAAVERYMDVLNDNDLTESAPPSQLIMSDIAVVAEKIEFRIPADELEIKFVVNPVERKTISEGQYDLETGTVAQGMQPSEQIARTTQRAGDVLDYDFDWLDVITPSDFCGLAETADRLLE